MEKKDIKKVVKSVTDIKMSHMRPYTKIEVEESLTEAIHKALIKSDVRTSCLRECWGKWLESKDEKDFLRWLLGQLA